MNAPDIADAQLRKNLILCSALFHTPPPPQRADNRICANCARLLRHALTAPGLWQDEFKDAFHGTDDGIPQSPVVTLWYSTLIELTRHEPESERLLNGVGNLVTPAGAHFTGCWLTPAGRTFAQRLLKEHPEWIAKLITP
ncbi:MAG: hypothetical protein ACHRHE_19955 [Tepidisphaerales bacterium]